MKATSTNLARLVSIVDRLRGPDGCPWDQAQSHASMRPYLLEECYEVLDAIAAKGMHQHSAAGQRTRGGDLCEELGDLLFVVLLLARMSQDEENGAFGIEEVADGIGRKMVERHPHVFGDPQTRARERVTDPGSIAAWEQRKERTRSKTVSEQKPKRRSRLDGVPRSLPALLRAHRQAEKAAAVGFDWPDHRGVLDKVSEELEELQQALAAGEPAAVTHEYGDVLLAVANLGRHIGATPEEALRTANDRFADRFAGMEALATAAGQLLQDLPSDELEALWERAKQDLSAAGSGE